jgi:hypothetical protein
MMASTLTCIDSSDDTIFSKFCDINPSYSTTSDNGERFCEFKIPISWFDPPLGCVYIIYQDTNEVYVGKTYHLGDRFHKYANSWDWDSTDIRTDHAANINKKILAGAEAGHCFEIWISPIKDESERVVVEKDTIHRTQPDWNNIMYEGKKRELGFDFNDQVYYEWAKDRMPFFDIFSDDYFRSGAQAYPPPVSPPYFSTASTGFDQDEEYPKRRSKEEVHPPDTGSWITSAESNTANAPTGFDQDEEYTKRRSKEEVHPFDPPRICPKCRYHVPADSKPILCPCGKWVL